MKEEFMNDNGEYLLEQMQKQPAKCSVIAVASGKGGVGKTSLSANLALCLASEGKKVVIFDADMGLANLDVVMNVSSRYNLAHFLAGQKSIEDIIAVGPYGVEIVCGANGIEMLADMTDFERNRIVRELDSLAENADALIIDTGAGIQKSVVGFCQCSQSVMVVTTPEPTAITDAYALIKVLSGNGYQGRINLVVNMAANIEEGKKVYRQIASVASRFLNTDVYEGGVIVKDELFSSAVKARKPVVLSYPRSKAAASLAVMARRLTRTYGTRQGEKKSFFKKVVSKFF